MRNYPIALLASAALSALTMAAPARCQTALTLNGMLDLGMMRDYDGSAQVGTVQRSNLALSGYEELGGGVKAIFRLSTRAELDTGKGEGAPDKPFWHDESTLGIKAAWGTLRVGRAMTAMWANDYKFDPWSNYNRIASPAWQHWHYLTPSDPFANNGKAEYGRLNNGVFFDSASYGGVTLRLSTTPERDARAICRPISAVVEYAQGSWAGMAAYERNSLGDENNYLAGKYVLGDAALMAAYDDSRALASQQRSRTMTLSATYRLGAATVLKAGYSRQQLNADSNPFVGLGADYLLSRRSTLYLSLGRKRQGAQGAMNSYGLGLSHVF
ncbi:porin [Duganella fentianensis]|uniref:porin n=1 Tax=Duganella fentianensis TaxID=2692177 RepID=UPI0032B22B37